MNNEEEYCKKCDSFYVPMVNNCKCLNAHFFKRLDEVLGKIGGKYGKKESKPSEAGKWDLSQVDSRRGDS